MPTALYVHLPFCKRKCFYCDFAIATGGDSIQQKYVAYLCREIKLTARFYPSHQSIQTIFCGGGTPSILPVNLLEKVLQTIRQVFPISPWAEISLEANPDSLNLEKLLIYRDLGINRISLGVQAFQDFLLEICGRDHSVKQVYSAIEAIQKAGFTNFSLDLISGLPQQTLDHWQDSLDRAIELRPTHLSIYDLIVEENTLFSKKYSQKKLNFPPEELTVDMYLMAREKLANHGFIHYEISNYAQPNYECQHNLCYWRNLPFYGVGMSATSYLNQQRLDRPRKMSDYWSMIDRWEYANLPPVGDTISPKEQLFELFMQGLRLETGINLQQISPPLSQRRNTSY
jgi:putative oxygen-independent coproporphyrinogen III oxidase